MHPSTSNATLAELQRGVWGRKHQIDMSRRGTRGVPIFANSEVVVPKTISPDTLRPLPTIVQRCCRLRQRQTSAHVHLHTLYLHA